MNTKPKVLFDTQLILRATINPRSLPAKLLFDLHSLYTLVSCPDTYAEAEDVLSRIPLRKKFPNLTDSTVDATLAMLREAQQSTPDNTPLVSRDPKDDKFLACAVSHQALFLVTEDQDLLVLNPYKGVGIVDAPTFLHTLTP